MENISQQKTKLPQSSYVEFEAKKLTSAQLLWVNPELVSSARMTEEDLLNSFAYSASDNKSAKKGDTSKPSQIFLADRYGSRHEACNGGSARCGIYKGWQVKGIGRNPLVAINIDHDHSHGKLCLTKAISEAVWGEICHRELPYGAIRTLAIIATGEWMDVDYGLNNKLQPCALIVRENAIRPAHFERATFFWPYPDHINLRENDAQRVQNAVTCITRYLPGEKNDLLNGLKCFVQRMAAQIATSRIKGIPHGSLTSSNISIDGRFLDFGTMSSVPDFANYILAAGQGGIWDDHLQIGKWFRHMLFFLKKYHQEKISQKQEEELVTIFFEELEQQENTVLAAEINSIVKAINNNIEAKELKQRLQQGLMQPRPLSEYDISNFNLRLTQELSASGVSNSSQLFPLRNQCYSFYTLACSVAGLIEDKKITKSAVTYLIECFIAGELHHV
ncbi:protein adenylyltransferase SelO family protein [Dryocola clanedunensis]